MTSSNYSTDEFIRIATDGVVPIYRTVPTSLNNSVLFILENEPPKINDTESIQYHLGLRIDKHWALNILLKNPRLTEVFDVFVSSLTAKIASFQDVDVAEKELMIQLNKWNDLFKYAPNELLSPEKIQGLYAELYILKNKLIPYAGVSEALAAWGGPESNNKDFEFGKTWFEIKSKSVNKDVVQISNIHQLISDIDGYLDVVSLEKINSDYSNGQSIFDLVSDLGQIMNQEQNMLFVSKLMKAGYTQNEEYKKFKYHVESVDEYMINSDFPGLKEFINIPEITNIKYEMYLPLLERFKVE